MKYIFKIFLAIVCLLSITASGQEEAIEKGNKEYNHYSFVDAQQAYLSVVENGFTSADILQKLGDSYYYTGDYEKAAKWYEALYADFADGLNPDYLYRYAQSLKSAEKYRASNEIMEQFYKVSENDNRAMLLKDERDYLNNIRNNERFEIDLAKFNTSLSDFAPAFYMEDLVFASNGQYKNDRQRIHEWNNQPFHDLYLINISAKKEDRKVKSLSGKINTKYHESTAVFTKDGQTVYFTRNNFMKGHYKQDSKGINRLKLYRGKKLDNGNWDVEEVPFNNNEYSVAHPALSPDENTLYFASDMPGGKGLSDLYKVEILADGYTKPESLGDRINTKERETFPFIGSDNRLYFASDGHVGLGGLDIFVTEIEGGGISGGVYNLGKPINSAQDDFTFIINDETEFGYFASNRPGGEGNDDIYRFKRIEPLVLSCNQVLEGFVLDVENNEPIADVTVTLLDGVNKVISEVKSNADGFYTFSLDCQKNYTVRSTKSGYKEKEQLIISSGENKAKIKQTLLLENIKE
jgi:tetratricopeptide (TPR) repeat protein